MIFTGRILELTGFSVFVVTYFDMFIFLFIYLFCSQGSKCSSPKEEEIFVLDGKHSAELALPVSY